MAQAAGKFRIALGRELTQLTASHAVQRQRVFVKTFRYPCAFEIGEGTHRMQPQTATGRHEVLSSQDP